MLIVNVLREVTIGWRGYDVLMDKETASRGMRRSDVMTITNLILILVEGPNWKIKEEKKRFCRQLKTEEDNDMGEKIIKFWRIKKHA